MTIKSQPSPKKPPTIQIKRSLCNTFGGCGAKRSLQHSLGYESSTSENWPYEKDSLLLSSASSPTIPMTKKDSSAQLVAEILSDLMDYLERNEKFRQGKYVVVVPRQYDRPTSMNSHNNQQVAPVELQELQFNSRFGYSNKNE